MMLLITGAHRLGAHRLGGLARLPLSEAALRHLGGHACAPPRSRDPTLVFDLDGTLVETAPDLCGAVNSLMRELGRPGVTLAQTKHMIGDGMAKLTERALEATGNACADEELATHVARLHDIYMDACCVDTFLYEGVEETLAELAGEGYLLAVCTNKPFAPAAIILEKMGVAHYFDGALVGGDTLGTVRKPDAEHLLHAVAVARGEARLGSGTRVRLAAGPDERALHHNHNIVMIGDGHNDILVAKAAGVPSIGLTYGYTRTPLAELGVDVLLNRFDEIPAVVAQLLLPRL